MKTPKHIFIVEDNEIYSMMLDYFLSCDSIYHFVRFKSGEECLENLHLNPDLIILDYGLPGINGYETLLQIKKNNPLIHVMILTDNKDMKLAAALLRAGADYHVLKQGHGERRVIQRIETILARNESENRKPELKEQFLSEKVFLFMLLTAGLMLAAFCLLQK